VSGGGEVASQFGDEEKHDQGGRYTPKVAKTKK